LRAENGARRLLPKHPAGSGYANTYADSNSNTHVYSDGYGNTDFNANRHTYSDRYRNSYIYADAYTYGDGNTDCDCNSYTYFDPETFTDAEIRANAQAASYTATAPVAFKFVQSVGRRKPPVPIPETPSGFHPHGPRNAFRRRGARPQSRSFALADLAPRRSRSSNRLC
jgi:hypothetical protein